MHALSRSLVSRARRLKVRYSCPVTPASPSVLDLPAGSTYMLAHDVHSQRDLVGFQNSVSDV